VLNWLQERSRPKIVDEMQVSQDGAWGIQRRVKLRLIHYMRRSGI